MMQQENMIEIEHLSKRFGDIQAVRDISFSVKKGSLFAFLGVNGAGKSTTISMMCNQLKADGGTIRIGGYDLNAHAREIRNMLGVVFQQSVLDRPLTVKDNLESRAALYGIDGKQFSTRLKELTELLGLEGLLNRPFGKLSGGQRRKIDIARALLHNPGLLILDEPTTGLDPQTRQTVWQVIARLQKEQNMTVFLTTHYMEEAADADRVIILDAGQIVAEGTPLELKNRYTGDFITLYGVDDEQIRALGHPYERFGDAAQLCVSDPKEATQLILQHPELFFDYEITKGKMDDVFLAATGKSLRADSQNELTGEEEKQ